MKDILPLIQALIIGLLALLGIALTQSWTTRREFAKRKIEFAEEVLALFYEIREALQSIRSPGGWTGEGSSRPRGEHESEEESQTLDSAYVVVERYKRYENLFSNWRAKKYRFMALFRGKSNEPFEEINIALNKVFVASHMLGSYYWQRQGRVHMEPEEFKNHLEEMKEQQTIFWMTPDQDPIATAVAEAVKKIEEITDNSAKEYVNPFDWRMRWKAFLEGRPQE